MRAIKQAKWGRAHTAPKRNVNEMDGQHIRNNGLATKDNGKGKGVREKEDGEMIS